MGSVLINGMSRSPEGRDYFHEEASAQHLIAEVPRRLTKACGYRMPASSTRCFAQRGQTAMPPGLQRALGPVLEQIAEMTIKIKQYDREIQRMTQNKYAETQPLLTIQGVGHITALTFVLTLDDKERFGRSRDVGCYLGLRPRRSQSGEHDPQLGITKAGNAYLRSLLIECANHILRPHGRDSALRQWGLHLAARGGKQAKSKAVVAVARKLAVLLHRIWTTQEPYIPFYAAAA
jgi:transposase